MGQLVQDSLWWERCVANADGIDDGVLCALNVNLDFLVACCFRGGTVAYLADILALDEIGDSRLAVARAADEQHAAGRPGILFCCRVLGRRRRLVRLCS